MPITTDTDKFRLELGDTPAAYGLSLPRPTPDPEFQAVALLLDDEIAYFLAAHPSSVLLAVAAACDALAVRFAREFDASEDGQSVDRSQKSKAFAERARSLRQRAKEDEQVAAGTAGMPIGRVPSRVPTTWGSRW